MKSFFILFFAFYLVGSFGIYAEQKIIKSEINNKFIIYYYKDFEAALKDTPGIKYNLALANSFNNSNLETGMFFMSSLLDFSSDLIMSRSMIPNLLLSTGLYASSFLLNDLSRWTINEAIEKHNNKLLKNGQSYSTMVITGGNRDTHSIAWLMLIPSLAYSISNEPKVLGIVGLTPLVSSLFDEKYDIEDAISDSIPFIPSTIYNLSLASKQTKLSVILINIGLTFTTTFVREMFFK